MAEDDDDKIGTDHVLRHKSGEDKRDLEERRERERRDREAEAEERRRREREDDS